MVHGSLGVRKFKGTHNCQLGIKGANLFAGFSLASLVGSFAIRIFHKVEEKEYICANGTPRRKLSGIPTRGNLFLPVRLLVWADGRGTVVQADNAARA
jgi:hypothetical protein